MTKGRTPEVLVVTAEAGEAQAVDNRRSVVQQEGVEAAHQIISGLGFKDAQEAVYLTSRASTAEWVLKLDADMVLVDCYSVSRLVALAERERLRRLTTPVCDFFTGRQIVGVHLFRVDSIPAFRDVPSHRPDAWLSQIEGRTIPWAVNPQITHAMNPSRAQSVRFGVNRAVKASIDGPRSQHWAALSAVEANYRRSGDVQLAYCLHGAATYLDTAVHYPVDRWGFELAQVALSQADYTKAMTPSRGHNQIWSLHRRFYGRPLYTARAIVADRVRLRRHRRAEEEIR